MHRRPIKCQKIYCLGRVFNIHWPHWLYKVLHHRIDGYTQYKERKIASDKA